MTARKNPERKSPTIEQALSPADEKANAGSNDRPIWEGDEDRNEYHARLAAWKLTQK